jgi:hypothetical protein
MELQLDLILKWINSRSFVKMIGVENFRNPKKLISRSHQRLLLVHKKKIHIYLFIYLIEEWKPRPKVPFEMKNQTTLLYTKLTTILTN